MKSIIKLIVCFMLITLVGCAKEEATLEVEETTVATEDYLNTLREKYEPCFLMAAYLGSYYDEVDYNALINDKEKDFRFIKAIDEKQVVKRYEEDCQMEVYLIIPASGSEVNVSYYELVSNEVGDVLYEGQAEPFLLIVPDLYGDPAVEVDISNELGNTWFYPSLELSDGSLRTNDSIGIIDLTTSEQLRPVYVQSLFDELCSKETIIESGYDLQVMYDLIINGHYYAVFANSEDIETCENFYAIRPGTYETYWSNDLANWTRME